MEICGVAIVTLSTYCPDGLHQCYMLAEWRTNDEEGAMEIADGIFDYPIRYDALADARRDFRKACETFRPGYPYPIKGISSIRLNQQQVKNGKKSIKISKRRGRG